MATPSKQRTTTSKESIKLVANGSAQLASALTKITSMFREHKYLAISIRPGRDRSTEQNRLWQAMYKRISEMTGQGSPKEVWAYCKLMIGVPILRRDDERFAAGYDRYFSHLSFEEQLFLMGANPLFGPDGFPVTRLFGTRQGSEYTDAIADYYAPKGVYFDDLLGSKAA